jgi:hypothetical protein
MTTLSLARTDIGALSETDAERLLRRVLKATNLKPSGEPTASAETRQSLLEGLQRINARVASEPEPGPSALDQLTKQALRVLAEDPVYGRLGSDEPGSHGKRDQPARDLSVDPVGFIGATSLALLVLNTYVDLNRRPIPARFLVSKNGVAKNGKNGVGKNGVSLGLPSTRRHLDSNINDAMMLL